MDEQWQSLAPITQLQNLVTIAAVAIGALVAMSGVQWSVPLLMRLATGVLLLSHGV